MKLGIFDSGLGGLLITKSIREALPEHDLIYFGDTLRMPYGNRSDEAIYRFSKRVIDWLFKQDCALIIMACNTASARALRRVQQEHLPRCWPDRNVLGVVVPTLEVAIEQGAKTIGVIGTNATISAKIYSEELKKLAPDLTIIEQATPLLAPLIENDGSRWSTDILMHYLTPLKEQGVESLILGCTHYAFLKDQIAKIMGEGCQIISQDDIIPHKLEQYLQNHPEYAEQITKTSEVLYTVSDLTDNYKTAARAIYGQDIHIEQKDI
ncbi:MAG: glutamate racemase [Pseudomonadota bacterium]